MFKAAFPIEQGIAEQPLSLLKQTAIVICASAVIAVCARLAVPLPFTPVPLTLANFGVIVDIFMHVKPMLGDLSWLRNM